MANPNRVIQTPGAPVAGDVGALNNINENPNTVGAQREAMVRTRAAVEAANSATQTGDLAGAAAVLASAQEAIAALVGGAPEQPAVDLSSFGPGVLAVSVAVGRRAQESYGIELSYPNGTRLDENMLPVTGLSEPRYVVGNLLTADGWVVSRAIPLPA